MYNALLGGVDLDGKNFCYTNPLVNTERATGMSAHAASEISRAPC